jgi:mono/diheme cytochrome c family protein
MKKSLIAALLMGGLAAFSLNAEEMDMEAAKSNWDRHCSKCHAEDGSASNRLGERMKIMDYTDPESLAKFSDEELFTMTKDGVEGTKMRGYGSKLSDEEIHALVKYMRDMAK